jgi:hypothetical protein
MIQTFELGESAIVCNARFHPKWNGEEVTVCTHYGMLPVRQRDGSIARELGYGVMTKDGARFVVQPWQLRRKRPRAILSSWDRCIWRPQILQAKVSSNRTGTRDAKS